MDKESIKYIREMQHTIDMYSRFVEHLFLLLKKDPNRQMLVSDSEDESIMNEICIEIDKLLVAAGRKTKEGI